MKRESFKIVAPNQIVECKIKARYYSNNPFRDDLYFTSS